MLLVSPVRSRNREVLTLDDQRSRVAGSSLVKFLKRAYQQVAGELTETTLLAQRDLKVDPR